jgi:large subunit ribosomal protein L13
MKYKTTWTKEKDIERNWYIIDVKDKILGRAATRIASLLIGKEKPEIVPNVDCGDYVIVINSDMVELTRGKEKKKMYYSHSQHPGGFKEIRFDKQMDKDSRKVILDAVKNMLPQNKLKDQRLNRLMVYKNSEHKHTAQKPVEIKF